MASRQRRNRGNVESILVAFDHHVKDTFHKFILRLSRVRSGDAVARLFGPVRKNESRLPRTLELQLLADLHFLLAGALLQAADAVAAMLDLASQSGVLLLKLADFSALLKQGLQALGPTHGDPHIRDCDGEQDQRSLSSHRGLAELLEQGFLYVYKLNPTKRPVHVMLTLDGNPGRLKP